ncbi:type IV pilus assembly protein PilM [Lyngbya confervoides]|uniref:Type IV pilus assembly protein PilM n=1 Tax=Lyngbya confervoides BDU141951 TaxID=1574623 RepID=A0ABD4SYB2_9CYAN|nr:type IV pilus assembly protein PilM [Lyngbya confervoides]MCM1981283.1 type IV pilus assembly protein PilM [Lyngbya confervoides BDU141951]
MPLLNFFSKKQPRLGIELTADQINVVQLQSQKQGYKVTQFACGPMPEGAMQDGQFLDYQTIAEALRALLDENGIKGTAVASAIPVGEAVIRLIRLPAELDDYELRDMVLNQEAALYLPFPREEADVDFQQLGTEIDEDGIERVEVLLVATPKEITNAYLEIFQLAGLDLQVLEVSSFAMIRAIRSQLLQFVSGEAIALVNIDADGTEISIVMDGVPQFNRKIPVGTQQMKSALSRAMNLPLSMGNDLLQSMTVPVSDIKDTITGIDENPSSAALLRVLGGLSDELRRSIDFYLNQGESLEVVQVFLSGPGAVLGQIDAFMAQRLGISASLIDPVESLGLQNVDMIPEDQRSGFGIVMGLGLREA